MVPKTYDKYGIVKDSPFVNLNINSCKFESQDATLGQFILQTPDLNLKIENTKIIASNQTIIGKVIDTYSIVFDYDIANITASQNITINLGTI